MQQGDFTDAINQCHFNQVTSSRHLSLNELLKQVFIKHPRNNQKPVEEADVTILKRIKKVNHQNQLDKIADLHKQFNKWR